MHYTFDSVNYYYMLPSTQFTRLWLTVTYLVVECDEFKDALKKEDCSKTNVEAIEDTCV